MAGSNEGNEGNEGNSGNLGRSGAGPRGVPVLPDRLDLPFITVNEPANERTKVTWQDRHWDPYWAGWTSLIIFAEQTGWKTAAAVPDRATTRTAMSAALGETVDEGFERRRLVRAAEDERADALGEIVAQHNGFIEYFHAMLCITERSHPWTCRLLHAASLIAGYACMHWKKHYSIARPSQIYPALMPPVPVPGHPSYPSGHATQAHLMALSVEALLKDAADGGQQPETVATRLARRIARNREIAGLHYGSDSFAGEQLATKLWAFINSNGAVKADLIANVQTKALGEWP